MVAAGLSGPARASVGAVRDYVLGVSLINGKAEPLTFGGQVMKNVAGYDVSRLMAGSPGARWAAHRGQPQGAARGPGRSHAAL
jgi:glycolate oxidase FAD binding subunit